MSVKSSVNLFAPRTVALTPDQIKSAFGDRVEILNEKKHDYAFRMPLSDLYGDLKVVFHFPIIQYDSDGALSDETVWSSPLFTGGYRVEPGRTWRHAFSHPLCCRFQGAQSKFLIGQFHPKWQEFHVFANGFCGGNNEYALWLVEHLPIDDTFYDNIKANALYYESGMNRADHNDVIVLSARHRFTKYGTRDKNRHGLPEFFRECERKAFADEFSAPHLGTAVNYADAWLIDSQGHEKSPTQQQWVQSENGELLYQQLVWSNIEDRHSIAIRCFTENDGTIKVIWQPFSGDSKDGVPTMLQKMRMNLIYATITKQLNARHERITQAIAEAQKFIPEIYRYEPLEGPGIVSEGLQPYRLE